MILGVGLDIVAVARVGEFLERAFTAHELAACEGRVDRAEVLAARFAAKEACFKALGTDWGGGVSLQQVEVTETDGGRPQLRLSGAAADRGAALGVRSVHVTLTHEQDYAAAVVILEG